jgi:hypothetical protein
VDRRDRFRDRFQNRMMDQTMGRMILVELRRSRAPLLVFLQA